MRDSVRERIPQDLYEDLYNRRKSVKEVAAKLDVSPNYLSHAIPERAKKRNPRLLAKSRRLFQEQVAREVKEGKHTVFAGAQLAFISERTMYRRLAQLEKKLEKEKQKAQNVQ